MSTSHFYQRLKFYLWVGLIWTILWLLSNVLHQGENFFHSLINETWRSIYLVAVNFFFFEFAWPYIFKKRRFYLYNFLVGIFLFFILMMVISFGLYAWRFLGIGMGLYTPLRTDANISEGISYQTSGGVMSLVFFGIIRHVYDYRKLKMDAQKLKIENQQAELNYLKSQTNPHFLFNTLNNIYSLARDKSDLAPESILRLSKILRFMLYETSGKHIAIEQELKIVSDYLALEKLRYDESLQLKFESDIDDMKQPIPPLLLIPLVENAFKHGVSETRGRAFIDIHLKVKNKMLAFTVRNSTGAAHEPEPMKENIGHSNLKRQLELLYKDYDLSVGQQDSVFTAQLKINLSSHV